ncbi:neuromedin B (predicted), isoform CRA_c [Rattus norvegicus]|uniref:Neuromedin B (Predicted), isoform CRA_c n=1 Tax=Rattus norvegicus TaxID=10116 RepID=A6JCD3_RAT|nr:neuromedin B (predicted), isoform CRA_c [Rattus norvegicus]EDM08664.1 neuromedin B (predicted), isoform CRA_c [Rattus norvegicus]EDM08665.1 neuromedin B (predicted), isoform CRA_c [Rattus norvegicus]
MGRCKSMMSHHGMERKPRWRLFSSTKATSSWMGMRSSLLLWSPPIPGTQANPELCCQQQAMPLCMCGTGLTSRPPDSSSFSHLTRGAA